MSTTPPKRVVHFSIVLSLFVASSLCQSATFTVNPGGDAFVTTGPTGSLSGNNYGGAGALSVAAPGSPQGQFLSVLEFSLAGARNFFDGVYGTLLQTESGAQAKEAVDLLLITLAREEVRTKNPETREFYRAQRVERWSPFLASGLRTLAREFPVPEAEDEVAG